MGKTIGNFKILPDGLLGKGTYAEVRRGVNQETGAPVAVKIIKKDLLVKDSRSTTQLFREIAIMQSLEHPNVVKSIDALQTANNVYLVMELVQGGELFNKIVKKGGIGETQARKYFHDLICGVRYVHHKGVAHRDLKPENILISETGLKISDFGLSNVQKTTVSGQVPNSMQLQTVCGTPNYVAPEILDEEGYNGFTADVWSCGVILYVMLAGFLPFHDSTVSELLAKILAGSYEMPSTFTKEQANLIRGTLQREPVKRITLDEIVRDPWFLTEFDIQRLSLGGPEEAPPALPHSVSSPRGDPSAMTES